jgi:hypothetical protein
MAESVEHFMERLRAHRGDGDVAYIARLEREVEERLRVNVGLLMAVEQRGDGGPRLLVCECGVVAKGLAQARCGRNGIRNIQAACPTRWMQVAAWSSARPSVEGEEREP